MNRNLVAQARKQLLRRGRALLRAAQSGAGASARSDTTPQQGPLGAIDEADLTQLQEIHAALERIERGIFGRCEDCQGEIDSQRVELVPWERRCAACREDGAADAAEASESRASA